jgi:hypothetical protein
LLSLVVSLGAADIAGAQTFIQRPEDELLLLEVSLDRTVLSSAIPAYPSAGGIIVPLGELSRVLDFAIEVDVARGRASGFFVEERRTFDLDTRGSRVVIEGKESSFEPKDAEVHQDDIYVDTRLLEQWWPIRFTIDLYASRIVLEARERLPIQVRREREQMIRKSLSRIGYAHEPPPTVENPYSLFDGPFVDQSLQFFGGNQTGTDATVRYATFASGDLLYHQADLYLLGSDVEALDTSRGRIGRVDPEGSLLGPLRAREYSAGDVLSPGVDMLLLPTSGDGVLLSNFPLQRQTRFDRHTFRGDLPPGWDVELYQNESLIAYQQSRSDGLYLFEEVPLLFGQNIFRLAFYGPQGQKREEIYRFNVGESLVPPGKLYYRLVSDDPDETGRRASLEVDYGITKQLSLDFAVADAETVVGDYAAARIGVSGFWKALFAKASVAKQKDGGVGLQLAGQTRIGALNLTLDHAELKDGFQTEFYRPVYGGLNRSTVLRGDLIIRGGRGIALPLSLEMRRHGLLEGGSVYEIQQRLGGQIRRTFFSNQIGGTIFEDSGGRTQLFGTALMSRHFRSLGLRGEIGYVIEPEPDLRSTALVVESFAIPDWAIQAGIIRAMIVEDTIVSVGANRREGPYAIGGTARYSESDGFSFSINLFAGITRDPRRGGWVTRARGVASTGAVSALVFLDRNGDGKRDPGEPPIENVGFFVNKASSRVTTDADGVALFQGLVPEMANEVSISSSTFEDPLLRAATDGVTVFPRAGKAMAIDFPVVMTGEITGTAYVERPAGTFAGAGLKLELVEADGTVFKQVPTAYDGFFEIIAIPPGQYVLRLEGGQSERLGLVLEPRPIRIEPTGTILDGLELRVRDQSN